MDFKSTTIKFHFSFFAVLLAVVVCVLPIKTFAATLFFSPSSGSHTVGSTFSVNLMVGSANQSMNAASGVVNFPDDKLEVTSISKSGSIFNLWVQEPTFSNALGSVNFEGVVLNPGFIGTAGKILTINFRVRGAGVAPVVLSTGQVLANDGSGTNILNSLGSASFTLNSGVALPPAEDNTPATVSDTPAVTSGTVGAPKIYSSTHPDEAKWYANSNPKVAWEVPKNVTAVRVLIDHTGNAVPSVVYMPAIASKDLMSLEDGIWYFHAGFKDASAWGKASHFKLQIDTVKPSSFEIKQFVGEDETDPKPKFVFDAQDKTSGIDYFEVITDGSQSVRWTDDNSHIYETGVLLPGEHTMTVKAVDKAGNFLEDSITFSVKPLETPIITDWPREISTDEQFVVKGTTKYPNAQVILSISKQGEKTIIYSVKTGENGEFIVVLDTSLKRGIYKLWAEVVDNRGARSLPTEKLVSQVKGLGLFEISSSVIMFITIVAPLSFLLFILLLLFLFAFKKNKGDRSRLRKEIREAEKALHKVFDVLKEDIEEKLARIEKSRTKKQLTKTEAKLVKEIKKNLSDAEKFVQKEIEDIEKEI